VDEEVSAAFAGLAIGTGQAISDSAVISLLRTVGSACRQPAETVEGSQHPDRGTRFFYVNPLADSFLTTGDPVIRVDTKTELVGQFRQDGREWHPTGTPDELCPSTIRPIAPRPRTTGVDADALTIDVTLVICPSGGGPSGRSSWCRPRSTGHADQVGELSRPQVVPYDVGALRYRLHTSSAQMRGYVPGPWYA
jgi:Rhodopirellula transposase DDE domain